MRRVVIDRVAYAKHIPYQFFTTAVNQKAIANAYTLSFHDLLEITFCLIKPDNFSLLLQYWKDCSSPSRLPK
jgi:hypothetical protein